MNINTKIQTKRSWQLSKTVLKISGNGYKSVKDVRNIIEALQNR